MKTHVLKLRKLRACEEAVEFAEQFNSIEETLENTERGDWILWLAQRVGVNKRKLTLAKALCAETVIHLMTDERSKKAVKIAKKYGKSEATEEELSTAAYAADAAYAAADAAAYAAYAAYAADAAADAAAYAAYAAYAADAAADAAYAEKDNQKKTAKISKEILFEEIVEKFNEL
jgi:hypothetical protein